MVNTSVSQTNRKVAIEKNVVGHSTQHVHQERSRLLTHLEATVGTLGPMSFAPFAAKDKRDIYAEFQSRSDCSAITVAKRLLCRADAA